MGKEIIYIFIGGGFGSMLRYLIQVLLHERIVPYHFPWATLGVNLVGSFLIGLFYALSERGQISPEIRLFLTAGICGGFTTFSTFSNDSLSLIKEGLYGIFLLYALISVCIGIIAVGAGGYAGKQF
jgi:CrcB protein